MKKPALFLILITLLIGSFKLKASDYEKDKIKLLFGVFSKYHVEPHHKTQKDVNFIFKKFLWYLDADQQFFTNQEIQALLNIKGSTPEEQCYTFFNQSYLQFRSKVNEYARSIDKLQKSPFNFNKLDVYKENKQYTFQLAPNKQAIEKRRKLALKMKVLKQMTLLAGYSDSLGYNIDSLKSYQKEAIRNIQERWKTRSQELEKDSIELRSDLFTKFLDCIAKSYDPHSNFFSPSTKKRFDDMVSKDALLFGFSLEKNDNGEIEIIKLVPGGAAWKSNKLHKGDVILEVIIPGQKNIKPSTISRKKLSEKLDEIGNKSVTFKVRKTDGSIKDVKLAKEKIEVDENKIKSYVLKRDKKVGYINLPSFYSDFTSSVQGCSNDVAKELLKLKRDSIDGLILDLRYNGGGSLKEAVDLSGIFIDAGPVLVKKNSGDKPRTMKDRNRGLFYDGPLIVMVNKYSASASEIVAGALQDYNRAIIIGHNSFGKATAQTVIPLDTTIMTGRAKYGLEYGYIKITIGKLYRVKGNTNQKIGVFPDIAIPGILDDVSKGESKYSNALKSDSVIKKVYYRPNARIKSEIATSNSEERISKNRSFQKIKQLNKSYKQINEKYKYSTPLDLKNYVAFKNKQLTIINQLTELRSSNAAVFNAEKPSFDPEPVNKNQKEGLQNAIDDINSDLQLQEAYLIMKDLIESK